MTAIKLMTHIVAGYPSLSESKALAEVMLGCGVSLLEIQIPFSDPVADGPTILNANTVALERRVTPQDCLNLMKALRKKTDIPLFFMTYFNILFRFGVEQFCSEAQKVGCTGLIVPDMPIDEEVNEKYLYFCEKYGLQPIQVISPLTPVRRLKTIAKVAKGFVYCVAGTGTTGERRSLPAGLASYLRTVRKYIKLPLAVGFGISTKEQVRAVSELAEIVVMGSKVLNLYHDAPRRKLEKVLLFLSGFC